MRASQKDLLSVQKSKEIEDWWMSRIMLIPWQLLPHRSWQRFFLWFLELMYISPIVYIKSNLTHLQDFHLLVLLP